MARDFVGKDEKLLKKIRKDYFMYLAVKECYESVKIVSEIINEVEMSINKSSFLTDFRMSELPDLHTKCINLVDLLVISFFVLSFSFTLYTSLFFYNPGLPDLFPLNVACPKG
ncbi:hypothetical protein IFM89_038243 [Coptis chinensis]|uniref:Callose synthase helical domain-containing protein n=1 Tax=Coptis chinensis TaxID=261450 RepID=A0A835LTM4_9MAGN|nr:hypothetical protein IFM89_038243 [Coptis chinensis]